MTFLSTRFLTALLLLAPALALSQDQLKVQTLASSKTPTKKPAAPTDPAERAFQANCSRCHYAPETLSPRITGTVVRHMRVRANLSAEEERLILSYFNP